MTTVAYILLLFITLSLVFKLVHFCVSSLLGGIFGKRNQHWVTKHFKKNSNVDIKKVAEFVKVGGIPPEDFTAWEMVATFGLLISDSTVSDLLKTAQTFGDHGWEKKYNSDFFDVLEHTAQHVGWKGRNKTGIKLLQLGQGLAGLYDNDYWENRLKEKSDHIYDTINTLKWDKSRRLRP